MILTVAQLRELLAGVDGRLAVVVCADPLPGPRVVYGREAASAAKSKVQLVGSDVCRRERDEPDETGLLRIVPLGSPFARQEDEEVFAIFAGADDEEVPF